MNLKIENRPAYIYKSYCWNASFEAAEADCWYVIDGDTGSVLAGGYSRGCNSQAGVVDMRKRREAKAWVAGYIDALSGMTPRMSDAKRAVVALFPKVSSHKLDDERTAYENGVYVGRDALVKKNEGKTK